jgi:hypothetical protein
MSQRITTDRNGALSRATSLVRAEMDSFFCQGLFRIKSWTRQPVEHVPLVVTRHAPDGKLWSPAPLAEQVDCFIDKDSCQPATEGAVVVELLKIANRAEQAVLHDVLSIFPAS